MRNLMPSAGQRVRQEETAASDHVERLAAQSTGLRLHVQFVDTVDHIFHFFIRQRRMTPGPVPAQHELQYDLPVDTVP